ncbi:MAG: class I SAM-dependent RNA methyltransferase [Firmicutes bacterium]|nr:class I SAM-dependent RNA methyltransferase [Bacillota bacterium]
MAKLELIATSTFGLEAVVKREVEALGYPILQSENGKICYLGDERAVVRSNLWLRCADRVQIRLAEFEARTFNDLFEQTKALPWEQWIPVDGQINVSGSSVKSQLHSVPACQGMVKKAIIEKLKETYAIEEFPETGLPFGLKVTILKDRVTLTLDTTGEGLHKRGYRVCPVAAPIKETLAAAMVQLSFWKPGRLLVDPFCGSGTIAIEAAMIERNIAPGLTRHFWAEDWDFIPKKLWKEERKAAYEAVDYDKEIRILASDIDPETVEAARRNAEEAGVDDCVTVKCQDARTMVATEEYGVIITNPPYGQRIGEKEQLPRLYRSLRKFMEHNSTWSLYLITADKEFEGQMMRPADRRRKLYNGRLETCLYQYYGARPPKA